MRIGIFIIGIVVGYGLHGLIDSITDTTSALLKPISSNNINTAIQQENNVIVQQPTPKNLNITQPKLQITPQPTLSNITPTQPKSVPIKELNTDDSAKELMYNIQNLVSKARYTEAFVLIEELLFSIQDTYSKSEIEKIFINTVYKQRTQHLGNDLVAQINLLNYAASTVPEYTGFNFDLANIFFKLGDSENAKYYLSLINHDVNLKEQIAKLLADIKYKELFANGDIQIPLIPKPNAWHIAVTINNQPAILILDTGATITVIRDSLMPPNYQKVKKVVASTANGTTDAYTAHINLGVGNIQNTTFEVLVLESNKLPRGVDGLLGIDFLNNYHFIIDKIHNILHLSPISK